MALNSNLQDVSSSGKGDGLDSATRPPGDAVAPFKRTCRARKDGQDGEWTHHFPAWFFDVTRNKMPDSVRKVLIAIEERCRYRPMTWVGNPHLMAATGLGETALQSAFLWLIANGWIHIVYSANKRHRLGIILCRRASSAVLPVADSDERRAVVEQETRAKWWTDESKIGDNGFWFRRLGINPDAPTRQDGHKQSAPTRPAGHSVPAQPGTEAVHLPAQPGQNNKSFRKDEKKKDSEGEFGLRPVSRNDSKGTRKTLGYPMTEFQKELVAEARSAGVAEILNAMPAELRTAIFDHHRHGFYVVTAHEQFEAARTGAPFDLASGLPMGHPSLRSHPELCEPSTLPLKAFAVIDEPAEVPADPSAEDIAEVDGNWTPRQRAWIEGLDAREASRFSQLTAEDRSTVMEWVQSNNRHSLARARRLVEPTEPIRVRVSPSLADQDVLPSGATILDLTEILSQRGQITDSRLHQRFAESLASKFGTRFDRQQCFPHFVKLAQALSVGYIEPDKVNRCLGEALTRPNVDNRGAYFCTCIRNELEDFSPEALSATGLTAPRRKARA